jgi:uncharacterized membrane protein
MRGSLLRHRPVLAASCAVGAAAGLLAGGRLPVSTALLVGWCAATAAHLALSVRAMARSTPEAVRRRAALLEDDKWAMLGGALAAAVASLGAVAADLAAAAPGGPSFGSAALAALTVALSWAFVHVLLARHYMHEYWLAGGAGLVFPGNDRPDAGEFLDLAFCIGMTCQVSDVTTGSAAMRRLVLLHGLVAFVFNAVILAAAVNIAAGIVH